jgi:hypothetical protein
VTRDRNALIGALSGLAVVLVAACGSGGSGSDGAPMTADEAAAGRVALAYASALSSGASKSARRYVASRYRGAFDRLQKAIQGKAATSHGLAVGSVQISGRTATATLTGTFCQGTPADKSADQCVTNHDPHTSNPIFLVHLLHEHERSWRVRYGP